MITRVSIICISVVLSMSNLWAGTIEVCSSCPTKTIKAAINMASPCDSVVIHHGLYKEGKIVIDKPLYLLGLDFPILDGDDTTEIITVISDHVHIEGLQIQNVGTSYLEDRAGLRIKRSKHFTIINNILRNTFFGIYLEHADDGTVLNNEIIGDAKDEMSSGNAIHVWYCKRIFVSNNLVKNHRDGIYFEFVDDSEITKNVSTDNLRYGLHFMFSNDDNYYHNTFRNNGAGVAVMFSKKINMWNNTFEKNWGTTSYGLLLKEIYDAKIFNNSFVKNTIGIYLEGSTRIKYTGNQFINNGWAMKISGGCLDNEITGNDFISNTFDLSVRSAMNNNTFDNNYWSSYTGYDLDRDGFGDVPYRPVKLFNYVVNQTPEAIILLRSFFVELVNFTEKVSPVFTPVNVMDHNPLMVEVNAG